MVMKRHSDMVLEEVRISTKPENIATLLARMNKFPKIYECKRSTAARALRRMRAKGLVSSQRNGGRYVLWTFNTAQTAKVPLSNPSSKGSSRSKYIMCRPDNMPTLCKEIEIAVETLVGNKTKFSAFDVTKHLRSRVSDEIAVIDTAETGTVYVGGKSVAKIDHEVVKEAVHDIFSCGEMGDEYTRTHTGSYWEYEEAVDDDDDSDDSDDDDSDDSDDGDYDGSSSI
jgi:hypothetical protein